ncbi:transporter substrate-binding domain-containing protein [Desulfovibrio sp. TomC]|uniref:transporter substrate-binding domain-containing protein n=1 Tax=Desulfovibrio sp. TomC TaxID=1562888 RepID=UPI00064D67F4|nr:transporter substrate-binding domain-containing protein [Desulfovibrio sp. TomC]
MSFCCRASMWRLLLAVLILCLAWGGSAPARAATSVLEFTPEEKAFLEAHPVIRFSDTDWRPLSIYEDGRLQGLFHDYYNLISQKTGLAFQFVLVGDGHDFQQVLDALRERRIDMIDGTGKTPDRANYALFVGPFLRFPLAIMSRDDAAVYSLESLAGKRVAAGNGGTAYEYIREHGKGIDLLPANDAAEALGLVSVGKADAAVENLAVAAYAIRGAGLANVKISGQLDYNFEIFSLVRKDWPLLATILQKAQAAVDDAEKAALFAKWLPIYKGATPAGAGASAVMGKPDDGRTGVTLTDRERDYLGRKKALAYCVDPDWAPIERIDENGRHVGISADFLTLMSERLGVPMVLVPTSSWSQSLAAVRSRRCDFLATAGETKERRGYLRFSSPYLRFPMVVATRAKTPFIDDPAGLAGKTLGVVNGYASLDILRAKYPDMHLMEVPSVSEGLRLVADGKLYGYIDTVPAISQAIAKDHFSDLKIAGRLEAQLDLSIASRDDEPELASLFQKAVNAISKEESDAIIKKWVAVTFEESFDYTKFWKALAGAALVFVLIVWWNRKLSRLNRAIRQAHEALDDANRDMAALLDNAGQGFLSVDRDGMIAPRYSQECQVLFGVAIAGKNVAELLFSPDTAECQAMSVNIRRLIDEPDVYRRDLYLSLMPKQVTRGEQSLRLGYRPLEGGQLMFVITDVTGEARLKDAVARERNRLACVVAAVREQNDFFAVIDSFADFRQSGAALVAAAADGRGALDRVYRQVHTFKGLFLQLECAFVAKALDALETQLTGLGREAVLDLVAVQALLADRAVDEALEKDLDVVRESLGPEFFNRRGEICLGEELAAALASLAERLLTRLDELPLGADDQAVLTAARDLRHVPIGKLLSAYPRLVARLAAGRGKLVAPFGVEGDAVLVDPTRFGPLAKSLVHAFRNAVDHGLETPDERTAAGKPETGSVTCRVRAGDGSVTIEVADDGPGVDVEAVRSRAFELELAGAEELAAMDDRAIWELLFCDGFTSRRTVGDLSGRGVGLAAVRAEAERLGGNASVISQPGQGMRLIVTVPLPGAQRQIDREMV